MKNLKKFGNHVLVFLLVFIFLVFNGCSTHSGMYGDNNEKSEKALNIYAEAVEKLKNEKNFDLKLTTSVKVKKIDCSMPLFNSILKTVFDYRIGANEDQVLEFSFVDGILTTDNTIVPQNIVQPVNSEINKDLYDGVTLSSVYKEDDINNICFVIGKETTSIDDILSVFDQLQDDVGTDFGNYDIHNDYSEIDALAKYHSNFIDIMSVAPKIKVLMDLNSGADSDSEQSLNNPGNFGKTTEIENGVCYLGDTVVSAQVDSKDRLLNVVFNAPLGIDVNINLMHNQFKAVICFEISQTYEYSYSK